MVEETVKTGVDDLMAFLRGKDEVPLLDAATALNVKPETLQSWVDFLVEEGILGIEYKFTKPFIYINRAEKKQSAKVVREEEIDWQTYRAAFLKKAQEKRLPEEKALVLWKNHVLVALEEKKGFFLDEARKRILADPERLWDMYRTEVLKSV